MDVSAYRWAADLTVAVHLVFVLFVVVGGLLVLWRRWIVWLHLPAVAWGAWIEFAGWICPLTPLENWLREQSGGDVYASTFTERYLGALLYPPLLTRELQWVLGGLVLMINVVVYAVILRTAARARS